MNSYAVIHKPKSHSDDTSSMQSINLTVKKVSSLWVGCQKCDVDFMNLRSESNGFAYL